MYIVPRTPAPLIMRNSVGTRIHFKTRADVARKYPQYWLRTRLVEEFSGKSDNTWDNYCAADEWICEENGHPLMAKDFVAHRAAYRSRRSQWNGEGPVPGISKRGRGFYHRRIHTMPERRMASVFDENEPGPRASRNSGNLPNSWDDLTRSDYAAKNWKTYRKTQWKIRKG